MIGVRVRETRKIGNYEFKFTKNTTKFFIFKTITIMVLKAVQINILITFRNINIKFAHLFIYHGIKPQILPWGDRPHDRV